MTSDRAAQSADAARKLLRCAGEVWRTQRLVQDAGDDEDGLTVSPGIVESFHSVALQLVARDLARRAAAQHRPGGRRSAGLAQPDHRPAPAGAGRGGADAGRARPLAVARRFTTHLARAARDAAAAGASACAAGGGLAQHAAGQCRAESGYPHANRANRDTSGDASRGG